MQVFVTIKININYYTTMANIVRQMHNFQKSLQDRVSEKHEIKVSFVTLWEFINHLGHTSACVLVCERKGKL